MFFVGNILRNLPTALEFHYHKWLLIYGSKRGKCWFSHIVYSSFTTMVSTEIKLWFLSSLEHFISDPLDTLAKVALFFEKIHKVFKNKVQWYSTPLRPQNGFLYERFLFSVHPYQPTPDFAFLCFQINNCLEH